MIKWLPKAVRETRGSGRIEHDSSVYVKQNLYDEITRMLVPVREAFDELIIGFSRKYKRWNGTPYDFRFSGKVEGHSQLVILISPEKQDYVQVLRRQIDTNSKDEGKLSPQVSGRWLRGGYWHQDIIRDRESAIAMLETENINPQPYGFYLPTCQDFENALRKCQSEGRKSIPMDDMLDILEKDFKEAGHSLVETWRSKTEKNIEIWSKELVLKLKINYDKERREIILEWPDQNIYDYFESRDFFFPKEILTRYFLSLKTKPFIILTGISGTGKTKIAQVFADYICQDDTQEEREKRIAFVPVRPDWMDNKGLLGYYNLLDEKYHVSSVLKLLLEAKENPGKPYFVILDEMNLAKVEQYFSDFLSIMESRTSNKSLGEPLELHSVKYLETQDGVPMPPSLHIPANVYFTGTVNVDESTYMFSPKVLDRANVIEFNDVDLENYTKGFDQSELFILDEPDVREKLLADGEIPFCSRDDYIKAKKIMENNGAGLQEILDILHPYNLHFGYRVVNEVSRFIVNTNELVRDFNINDTLDIQILQKILPKFHGSQAKLDEPIRRLVAFCYHNYPDFNESLLVKDNNKVMQNGDIRFPRSLRKLSRMFINLRVQGYTSFIE